MMIWSIFCLFNWAVILFTIPVINFLDQTMDLILTGSCSWVVLFTLVLDMLISLNTEFYDKGKLVNS
jgi:hypothetical protein